jgi:hypothetical protein
LQSAFATWYNETYKRHGTFWADRFKSVLLGDAQAVLDCMLYVELNPVRANLCNTPEEYKASSFYLRSIKTDGWLMSLENIVGGFHRRIINPINFLLAMAGKYESEYILLASS